MYEVIDTCRKSGVIVSQAEFANPKDACKAFHKSLQSTEGLKRVMRKVSETSVCVVLQNDVIGPGCVGFRMYRVI